MTAVRTWWCLFLPPCALPPLLVNKWPLLLQSPVCPGFFPHTQEAQAHCWPLVWEAVVAAVDSPTPLPQYQVLLFCYQTPPHSRGSTIISVSCCVCHVSRPEFPALFSLCFPCHHRSAGVTLRSHRGHTVVIVESHQGYTGVPLELQLTTIPVFTWVLGLHACTASALPTD